MKTKVSKYRWFRLFYVLVSIAFVFTMKKWSGDPQTNHREHQPYRLSRRKGL